MRIIAVCTLLWFVAVLWYVVEAGFATLPGG